MSDRLAILVPVLGRPQNVEPLLANIGETTPAARVVFVASPGDTDEIREIRRHSADMLVVDGNYARKINAGVWNTTEPYVFTGADDLRFTDGWFDRADRRLEAHDGVGVIGTNDLCNRRTIFSDHSTHSLVTRAYTARGTIDDPTRLLYEGYPHEFVDDEFVETAKRRGAYLHCPDVVVEHLHPMVGKASTDALYDAQPTRMQQGKTIFLRRRWLWT